MNPLLLALLGQMGPAVAIEPTAAYVLSAYVDTDYVES